MDGKSLQIGPDLVGNVTVGRDSVRTDDAKINLCLLHQKATSVIDDQSVGQRRAHPIPTPSTPTPGCAGAFHLPTHAL